MKGLWEELRRGFKGASEGSLWASSGPVVRCLSEFVKIVVRRLVVRRLVELIIRRLVELHVLAASHSFVRFDRLV